ncbi:MAG: epoxyqueuosine reductase QueH [Candidatus Cloacimonetes bacterium]|nr:epoxyqueuosine reductase QueH [Candidatus Cloacimonadota bacterium]
MPKLLVHICCAPCFIAPYQHLKDEYEIHGFWYNHNIHPWQEYRKRLDTLKQYVEAENIPLICKDEYNLDEFLRNSVFRENRRCEACYYERLRQTAAVAKKGNFDFFTSTLLYSKFQNHEQIKAIAASLAEEYDVAFLDHDLREYWKEGIELSKAAGMYRQQYCGCIYSERDRYYRQR